MILKEVIKLVENEGKLTPPFDIEYRITLPPHLVEELGEEDTLYGYCHWDGKDLIPDDQDDYSINDDILHYEVFEVREDMAEYKGEKALSVTIEGEWITSNSWPEKKVIPDEEPLPKTEGRTRGERRKRDYTKAVRKRNIAKAVYPSGDTHPYYDNLHQYSKGKIHCSCSMCSDKTNSKGSNGKGRRYDDGFREKLAKEEEKPLHTTSGTTTHRMGANYKHSEAVVIDSMNDKMRHYEQGDEEQTLDEMLRDIEGGKING